MGGLFIFWLQLLLLSIVTTVGGGKQCAVRGDFIYDDMAMYKKKTQKNVLVHNGRYLEVEDVPAKKLLSFLYKNRLGRFLRRGLRTRSFSCLCGWYYGSELSRRHIKPFIRRFGINADECAQSIDSFTSFDDFFSRKLKPNARSINKKSNVLAAPCDGRVLIFPSLEEETLFLVKQSTFSLSSLLQSDSLAKEFVNPVLMLFRLAPPDYHRYHFPLDGFAFEKKVIKGLFESVNPIARDSGCQSLEANERHVTLLKSNHFGTIAIVAVGAMCVGKITETYLPNTYNHKGDEMGYFSYGGSLIALVLSGEKVVLEPSIVERSKQGIETKVLMGSAIAWKQCNE